PRTLLARVPVAALDGFGLRRAPGERPGALAHDQWTHPARALRNDGDRHGSLEPPRGGAASRPRGAAPPGRAGPARGRGREGTIRRELTRGDRGERTFRLPRVLGS